MKISNILWGVLLVILGIIFGLNALDIADIDIFFDGWWTLFIIVPCFIDLFKSKDKTGNIIGILVGVILLLGAQDVLKYDIILKLLVPAILVLIGLSIIFKDSINGKIKSEIKNLNDKNIDTKEYYSTFSGQNLDFAGQEFSGCSLNSVFGGIKCMIDKANISQNCVVDASAVFGGITIHVPQNVNVKISSTPIFGGVSDRRENKNNESEITLYINATCIFGGIEIR